MTAPRRQGPSGGSARGAVVMGYAIPVIGYILMLAASVLAGGISLHYQLHDGLYPALLAFALILLALVDIARTYACARNHEEALVALAPASTMDAEEDDAVEESITTAQGRQKLLIIVLLTFAYIYLADAVGYFLCTFLYIIVFYRVVAGRQAVFLRITVLSLVGTALLYFLFDYLLNVPFPDGFMNLIGIGI